MLIQDGPYWETGACIAVQVLVRHGRLRAGPSPASGLATLSVRGHAGRRHDLRACSHPALRDVLSSDLTRSDPSRRDGSVVQGGYPWVNVDTPGLQTSSFINSMSVPSRAATTPTTRPGPPSRTSRASSPMSPPGLHGTFLQLLPVHEFLRWTGVGLQPGLVLCAEVVLRLAVQPCASRRRGPPPGPGGGLSSTSSTTTPDLATTSSGVST